MTTTPEVPSNVPAPERARASNGVPEDVPYALLADALPAMVIVLRDDGTPEFFNCRWYEYTGLPDDGPASAWRAVVHPDDLEAVQADAGAGFEARRPWSVEFRARRHDGSYRWHAARAEPVDKNTWLPHGGWVCTANDIDERKRAEEQTELAAELYRALAETQPSILLTAGSDGSLTYANRRWYEFTGESPHGSLDAMWERVVHPDDAERVRAMWRGARERGAAIDAEYRIRDAEGAFRWHLARTAPVRGPGGAITTWVATLTDVDDAWRMRERQEFLASASARFADSLERDQVLRATTEMAVPYLADWCAVFTRNQQGRLERAITAGADYGFPASNGAEGDSPGLVRVLETGEPIFHADTSIEGLRVAGVPEPFIEATVSLGFISSMLLPLKVRGAVIGVLVLAARAPRRRFDEQILEVAQEFARRASATLDNAQLYADMRAAESAQDEARALLDTIIESAPLGIAFLDRDLKCQRVNDALASMTGQPVEAFIGHPISHALPHVGSELEARYTELANEAIPFEEIETVFDTGTSLGRRAWLSSAYPVRGPGGAVIGFGVVMLDVTERRELDDQRRFSELRYRMLANTVPEVVLTARPDGDVDYYNERWYAYTGLDFEQTRGSHWRKLLHKDDARSAITAWERGIASGSEFEFEARFLRHDGEYCWQLTRATPLCGDDGGVLAWFAVRINIDDRKREEVKQKFLADATNALAASLDYQATLTSVAQLAVPEIADWCAVDVLEDGTVKRLAVTHIDEAKVRWAYELQERYPSDPDAETGVPQVLRSGAPELWPEITDGMLVDSARDETHLAALREIGFTSAMVVPMVAAGEVLGAITLVTAESNRHYDAADVSLGEELGRRAGIAIDNAKLYRNERAARTAAEEAGRRVTFLSEASKLLAASLNYDKNLADLAHLMVPHFADWCRIDIVEDDELRTVAIANVDPARERALIEYTKGRPVDMNAPVGPPAVVRTGEAMLFEEVTEDVIARVTSDADAQATLRGLGMVSYLCVPLSARGRTLGALSLTTRREESGRRLTLDDKRLAEEVAARAAIAIDNARLFGEAQRTAADLRVANRAKDEFLGLVSHELRTPITTIFGNAQVLRRRGGELPVEVRDQAVEDIERESDRLHRIIDNMLVLSRLEAGRSIETEPVSVDRMVSRVVESFKQRHSYRQINVDCDANLPAVAAEPVYFEQVLRNLLSNADKYSAPNQPISVVARGESTDVAIRVLDSGQGIAPDETEIIFRAFFRSPRTAAQASGAGIGLAVCRRLIEAQGGRIWARPRDEGGAEFGFTLPLEEETKR